MEASFETMPLIVRREVGARSARCGYRHLHSRFALRAASRFGASPLRWLRRFDYRAVGCGIALPHPPGQQNPAGQYAAGAAEQSEE